MYALYLKDHGGYYSVHHEKLPESDYEIIKVSPMKTFKKRLYLAISDLHTRYEILQQAGLLPARKEAQCSTSK